MASDRGTPQRPQGISYLQIPAPDPGRSGEFYSSLFGWSLRGDPASHLGFSDGTSDVIGAFVPDLPVAREPGLLPYVFVEDVGATIGRSVELGGEVVVEPYREPPDSEEYLTVARIRDPAGNVIGVWQMGG
jgi:predicted enzyme related to lactoylglutathione lyase